LPEAPRKAAGKPAFHNTRRPSMTRRKQRGHGGGSTALSGQSATAVSPDGTVIGYQTLGSGEAVILIGGTLRSGRDYLPLARLLAQFLTVHVMDRRGRGASGPQGAGYSIEKECEDLLAVARQTGAALVFGHSYGGLISLEAARRGSIFRRVAVYEPGVSVAGSMPVSWLGQYRRCLAAGDTLGAFAVMARGAGYAPALLARMPLSVVRALMYCIPSSQWQQLEPLLPAALAENEQIAKLDAPTADRFASVTSQVLLLGGTKSPAAITTRALQALHGVIPGSELRLLTGLGHTAPEKKAPTALAEAAGRFLHSSVGPAPTRKAVTTRLTGTPSSTPHLPG
jgi:pimeloyl-ACP methyl ester carboxylesterase